MGTLARDVPQRNAAIPTRGMLPFALTVSENIHTL